MFTSEAPSLVPLEETAEPLDLSAAVQLLCFAAENDDEAEWLPVGLAERTIDLCEKTPVD